MTLNEILGNNRCRTIIDGYNLIFQCGLEGRSRNTVALERARDRLVAVLVGSCSQQECSRIMIVFDAKSLPVKEVDTVSEKGGITIVYAVDYEDADTLIEDLILKHSTPKRLTVVSSDHRLHKAALRRKAQPIDSDVWFERINRSALVDDEDTASCSGEDFDHFLSDKSIPEGLEGIDWAKEFGLDDE